MICRDIAHSIVIEYDALVEAAGNELQFETPFGENTFGIDLTLALGNGKRVKLEIPCVWPQQYVLKHLGSLHICGDVWAIRYKIFPFVIEQEGPNIQVESTKYTVESVPWNASIWSTLKFWRVDNVA